MQYIASSRRAFITAAASAFAGSLIADGIPPAPQPRGIPLHQERLPFAFEALEPFMSAQTLRRHYEEHHAAYLQELQGTLEAEEMMVGSVLSLMPGMERMLQPPKSDSRMPLGRLVSQGLSFQEPQTLSQESILSIRRAGGGHINHTLFWRFLCPPGSGPSGPQGRAARAIQEDFGSIKAFRQIFKEAAMNHHGSGWAWLVYRPDGCLVVSTTANEDNPFMKDHVPWQEAGRPILLVDLWEHSYYEQYREDREQYIDAWWKVVNWEYVTRAYGVVTGKA